MNIFILGLGYVGQHLKLYLKAKGHNVSGIGRDISLLNTQELEKADAVLVSYPPSNLEQSIRNIFPWPQKKWMGYLSATSVYGDYKGDWVDEECTLLGDSPRALASGIYGPGRSAFEQLKKGGLIIVKQGHFFSRIHVEDIVQVLFASIQKLNPGRIYNLADDMPAASYEVNDFAAQLMKINPPHLDFENAKAQGVMSEMALDFYSQNKRVSNARIKKELIDKLMYPSYKEGLMGIFKTLIDCP
jgi:nucleoside-diphosphate-sugar epimerase